ncbi:MULTISPECIES: malonyl-ACP O-methyltransferase BioC [unclassified Oleiphilus]|jgi:malonyl-CoA O-methyltransferase|uniref:malonyl-ACP O-methyltransferase BioC n=1 Tax=unclassified Oleiphilus TaxID=2631174 RepID=UPI0007C30663|nr:MULTISPECIES: malonyl-ACP O-methyltransferase BioC [unclassified Oleiphilus]KZY40848.1 hypothetical protein A3732_19220 [Oleiphilus sp. HI0050]KZY76624.1 hypothetical protein A3740_12325 [Oleiphilus sp. HI0068]KZY80628.1 hypothetical protein A3741_18530 [Oleiphilus sp. HI0069]KZY86428.1 hypothetical protein A3743_16985 [Oleiphilus sp. HI0072]KZZ09924.1 hypothetical protein A3749_12360 [Oleiphilus sp. HI0078]KZZ23441.1 hypothetical protein A3752_00585 [Oleiphilus sp. HI0081]
MTIDSIEKSQIARSFGRAAASYDSVAHFQRWTADRLLSKISLNDCRRMIDLGCGTGYSSDKLKERFSSAEYMGVDLSVDMLTYARSQHAADGQFWLAGDAENLPIASSSHDLVFSSLAIQWCADLPKMFAEVQRILKPGGMFAFSTLIDGSLFELKEAWHEVDELQHVNEFGSFQEHKRALDNIAFDVRTFSQEAKVLRYSSVRELTRELKMLGAHNITAHRPTGMTGKAKLRDFVSAYEAKRVEGGYLPATYQVLWGVLVKT